MSELYNTIKSLLSFIIQNSFQYSITRAQLICYFQFFMRISLLFPYDEWNQWSLNNDNLFEYLKNILKLFNAHSILKEQNSEPLNYIACYVITFLHLFMFLAFIFSSYLIQKKILERQQLLTFFHLFYLYFLEIRYIFLLPTLVALFYLQFESSDSTLTINILLIFPGSLAFIINLFLSTLLIRKNSFNSNFLISNYTNLSFLSLFFEITISILQFQQHNNFLDYLRISLIISHNLLLIIIDLIYGNNLELFFKLHIVQLVFSIIVGIDVIMGGQLVQQQELVFVTLFIVTLCLPIAEAIWNYRVKIILKIHIINLEENFIVEKAQLLQDNLKNVLLTCIATQYHLQYCKNQTCLQTLTQLNENNQVEMLKKSVKLIILCLMQTCIQERKQKIGAQKQQNLAYITQIYISFLAKQCKSPLIAFIELKENSSLKNNYFQFLYKELNEIVSSQIINYQIDHDFEAMRAKNEEKNIEIHDINLSLYLEQKYLPQFLDIVESKSKFWERLLNGFQEVSDFYILILEVTKKMQKCIQLIQKEILIDVEKVNWQQTCQNQIFQLRLLSLYYSFVMNDSNNSLIIEQLIEDTLRYERSLNTERILNISLIDDEVILIQTSVSKHRGLIKNKDKKSLAKFFGYENEMDFKEISYINQLMPSYISSIHDSFLHSYLESGKSNIFNDGQLIFLQNKAKFIECGKLKLDNCFEYHDDYVIIGSIIKIKKSYEYLIFDELGQVLAITEQLMKKVFPNIELYKLLSLSYSFLILPQLFMILEKQRESFFSANRDDIQEDRNIYLTISKRLTRLLEFFNQYKTETQIQTHSKNCCINDFKRFDSAYSRVSSHTSKKKKNQNKKKSKLLQVVEGDVINDIQIPLYNQKYKDQIYEFLNQASIRELLEDCSLFTVRGNIQLHFNGKKEFKRAFFVLEVTEMQDRQLTTQGSQFFIQQYLQTGTLRQTFHDHAEDQYHLKYIQGNLTCINFCQVLDISNTSKIEDQQLISKTVSQVTQMNVSEREILKKEIDQGFDFIDNSRGMSGDAPLSQRAHFNPIAINQSNIIPDEMKEFEDDFKQLLQQQSSRVNVQAIKELLVDLDENNNNEDDIDKEVAKSSSHIDIQQKNILQILQQNQMQMVDYHNEELQKIKGSSTSTKTNSSYMQGINIIKSFQKNNNYIPSLFKISLINVILFFVFIGFITTSMTIFQKYQNEGQANIDDISSPILFNVSYCKLLIYSWYELLTQLNIFQYSQYIQKRFLNDSQLYNEDNFAQLNQIYPIFFSVESRDLLPVIQLQFMNGVHDPNVAFTKFFIITQEKQQLLTEWIIANTSKKAITQETIDDIFFLRSNLMSSVKMNRQLVRSLQDIFFQTLQQMQNTLMIFLIGQILATGFIISSQLYFWNKVKQYQEKLMLIITKLYEKDINIIQARLLVIKNILNKQARLSWKQCNFNQLGFWPLSQEIAIKYGITNKQFQNLINNSVIGSNQNQSLNQNQSNKGQPKKGGYTVLSTRIQNIKLPLFFTRLIIGFLFILISLYFTGGFIFYLDQQNQLTPTQQLMTKNLVFTQDLDTLICMGLIIKTQALLVDNLKQNVQFEIPKGANLSETDEILINFIAIQSSFDSQLFTIFSNILQSTKIDEAIKDDLFLLYKSNFCDVLFEQFPFCQFDSMPNQQFVQQYGQYDEKDDNFAYLEKGILGLSSVVKKYIAEYFDEEIQLQKYSQKIEILSTSMKEKTFINIFIEHWFDTKTGLRKFKEIILFATRQIMKDDLNFLFIYEIISGLIVSIIFCLTMITWIRRTHREIRLLRLGLSLIPVDILNDPQTVSLFKRLEFD